MPCGIVSPMKKTNARKRSSPTTDRTANQNTTSNEVDQYLASVPEPSRSTLSSIRATIRSIVPPDTTETISYMIPMFKYKGLLIGFAALQTHCSLFVTDPSVMQLFKNELKRYDISKGTIRFPADKPLPSSLLKKIVKARIAQNEARKKRT
jgi:uncharacterized protein YdhG (YjbR/CyaY superfamily)